MKTGLSPQPWARGTGNPQEEGSGEQDGEEGEMFAEVVSGCVWLPETRGGVGSWLWVPPGR